MCGTVRDRLSLVSDRLSGVSDRLSGVSNGLSDVSDRLSGVRDGLSGVSDRLSDVSNGLSGVSTRLSSVRDRLSSVRTTHAYVSTGLSNVSDARPAVSDRPSPVSDGPSPASDRPGSFNWRFSIVAFTITDVTGRLWSVSEARGGARTTLAAASETRGAGSDRLLVVGVRLSPVRDGAEIFDFRFSIFDFTNRTGTHAYGGVALRRDSGRDASPRRPRATSAHPNLSRGCLGEASLPSD